MIETIKKWGINGEGIAYHNKKAIFVDNAIPDEVAEIEIDEDEGSYARGHAVKILEPSPRRRNPMCRKWNECGGCSLMHVDSKGQVRMKEKIVQDALRKYADYNGPIQPLIKNPTPLAYRNSCKMPFGLDEEGRTVTGMYKRNSNEFVPIERCLIHSKKLEAVRAALMELLQNYDLKPAGEENPEGLKTLVLKEFDDKVHVVFVTGKMELPDDLVAKILETIPDAASVWQSVKESEDPDYELFGNQVFHLGGDMKMTLSLGDYALDLLPKSFFQLNTAQAMALYQLVASWIPEQTPLLVEAYSGVGAISLFAADKAQRAIGIESIEDAVANANTNALINGKENLSFVCNDAADELAKISETEHVDVLVVDPPRSGLNDAMKEAILKAEPERLIYVSCNPSTLGKDLSVLQEKYAIRIVQPLDFFSQTPHVETAVLLEKSAHPKGRPVPVKTEKRPARKERPSRAGSARPERSGRPDSRGQPKRPARSGAPAGKGRRDGSKDKGRPQKKGGYTPLYRSGPGRRFGSASRFSSNRKADGGNSSDSGKD